jgi:hypothetical protein
VLWNYEISPEILSGEAWESAAFSVAFRAGKVSLSGNKVIYSF